MLFIVKYSNAGKVYLFLRGILFKFYLILFHFEWATSNSYLSSMNSFKYNRMNFERPDFWPVVDRYPFKIP